MANIGPHLLGRVPSPDDPRDFQMRSFLAAAAPVWTETDRSKSLDELRAAGHLATWGDVRAMWKFLKATPQPPVAPRVEWRVARVLDQGDTGHCVGFGHAAWGDAAPTEDAYQNADGHAIYYEAVAIEGRPNTEDGSSVRAGMQAMQARGRVVSYWFAASVGDVRDWVRSHGPVVFGTDWYTGMFRPQADGLVMPTGRVEGGHCYLCIGHDSETHRFQFQNSWGDGWGAAGRFFMHEDDVATLLASQGEACAAVEVAQPV